MIWDLYFKLKRRTSYHSHIFLSCFVLDLMQTIFSWYLFRTFTSRIYLEDLSSAAEIRRALISISAISFVRTLRIQKSSLVRFIYRQFSCVNTFLEVLIVRLEFSSFQEITNIGTNSLAWRPFKPWRGKWRWDSAGLAKLLGCHCWSFRHTGHGLSYCRKTRVVFLVETFW